VILFPPCETELNCSGSEENEENRSHAFDKSRLDLDYRGVIICAALISLMGLPVNI
jgi:hypothetical protein